MHMHHAMNDTVDQKTDRLCVEPPKSNTCITHSGLSLGAVVFTLVNVSLCFA